LHEALKIYRDNFKPSEVLDKPYTIAGVNILAADDAEYAEHLLSSLILMFYNVLTGRSDYLQPPAPLTADMRELWKHPSLQQMLKFTFIGDKERVRIDTQAFLQETQVDEIMVVSNMYHFKDRLKSLKLFSEVMQELNK